MIERSRPHPRSDASAAEPGQRAVRRLARQINLGWWLACWLPLAAAIGLLGMVAMLYARWRAADSAAWVAGGIVGAFVVAAIAAWWRSRHRFESQEASRGQGLI